MFVRVKKIGPYEYLYLVENTRQGGRHVQRIVKALGRRDQMENSDLLDGLIASAARHSRRSIVLSRFYRGELAELHRRSIGPTWYLAGSGRRPAAVRCCSGICVSAISASMPNAPSTSPCCIG